ncbi:MAG: superoxide dismutase, Ni [Cyanobacteria bacterium P01_H01_bin.74]
MTAIVSDALEQVIGIETVQAHCDIPCKIYDPSTALLAALSVVRLIDIMEEKSQQGSQESLSYQNTIARCTFRKEEEAEKVKQEIRVIWGDYFKEPQFTKYPDTNKLVHAIMLKASACKQGVKRQDALDLVELVNQFAENFWGTKGIETQRKTCPYPPALEIVYPVL